jgi:hypothetical protein
MDSPILHPLAVGGQELSHTQQLLANRVSRPEEQVLNRMTGLELLEERWHTNFGIRPQKWRSVQNYDDTNLDCLDCEALLGCWHDIVFKKSAH